VWAVGDGADGSPRAKALARLMADSKPARFLYLGDVYERGTPAEFRAHYHSVYGRLNRVTAPTPGNRDWPLHTTGYDAYWRRVRGKPIRHYYSFSLAGWQIISLNSEGSHASGSAQLRWLRRQLRGRGTCRLAFWHQPRYSAGPHGDQPDVEPFWAALQGHARVVLNGHEHNMQRFPAYRGITELVAGAGGAKLYGTNHADARPAFVNETDIGALRISLRPGAATYRFVTTAGRTLDRGSVHCRR
jgi:Calcineurin-like phosphoesterase